MSFFKRLAGALSNKKYRANPNPVALFIIAGGVVIFLNIKHKIPKGATQEVMKKFVCEQIPAMQNTNFNVINLVDIMATTPHIWVVAYHEDGMHIIPTLSNPLTQSMSLYEDLTPTTNLKKQIAAKILSGNKSEKLKNLLNTKAGIAST